MLKKSASFVLTSLKASTYQPGKNCASSSGRAGENGYASPVRHWALTGSRPSASMTLLIRRVADLAVALPDGLFDHPASAHHSIAQQSRR